MNERNFETPYVELRDKSDQWVSERDLQIKETSCDSELESMAARGLPSPQNRRGAENTRVLEILVIIFWEYLSKHNHTAYVTLGLIQILYY